MKTRSTAFAIFLVAATLPISNALADIEEGESLHQESCVKCHMVGGDHTALYTAKDHKVKDMGRLKGMVSMCTQNLNIEWFPDEQQSVIDYLNKQYYHFK